MLIARKFVKETRFSCGAQMAHFATSEGASTSFQDFSLGNRETCATTRNYSEWNEHMLIIIFSQLLKWMCKKVKIPPLF